MKKNITIITAIILIISIVGIIFVMNRPYEPVYRHSRMLCKRLQHCL